MGCTVSSHFIYYEDGQQALFTLHHCYNDFCHPIDDELILPFRFGTKLAQTQLPSWERSHILPMRKIIGTQPHSKGGYVSSMEGNTWLAGFCMHAAPVYIAEIAPASIRGTLVSAKVR